jgi:uncharacterized membrane protein YkoI
MNGRNKIAGILGAALVAGAIGTGVATAAGGQGNTTSHQNASAAHKHSPKHTGNHNGWEHADENEAKKDDDASDQSISDRTALEKASAAALKYTGEGRVTQTEQDDEESYYEVEVTLNNGHQVDVQLNRNFKVVSSEDDGTVDND